MRLDNESSKLLLLTPHNDTVYDLQDALGLPASNYPPTLYDFHLTILYKQNFLATNVENLKLFNRPDHTGTREITPSLHEVTPMEIYWHIQKHSDELTPQLETFATLKAIVEIVHSCPKGFTTGPLHSLRTLCALRHGMFHIGKDRVDLDSFAAFLTQPDTVEFAHDGITIDSCAPFTRESWLFTHQISSYGAWTFLPLALRLTMHSARFELTLALRQEVPKSSCFQVTPDLFHWQGHLLDGVRVTLSFGIGCLELASDTFLYVRFPYPEPGSAPQLEVKGWKLTPDCGSYFFSRASHSLGHLHPSRSGVVDPSDYARPASLLKWPATSPATRSRYAHLPHHQTPDAPPKLLPAASIPYYHMGMDQLCQPKVLHDTDLVPSLWLAAFAALMGISLTSEHNALLQHPLIPPQFPSRVIAPLLAGDVDTVTDYVTEILAVTGPSWAVKNRRPRSSGSQSPPDDASIQELPRTTLAPLPSWVDDLHARISQLAVLIHDAQDLARSPSGWIKTSALIAYNGPSIPGNFDTHSGEIVNTSTFLLKVHGLSQPQTQPAPDLTPVLREQTARDAFMRMMARSAPPSDVIVVDE